MGKEYLGMCSEASVIVTEKNIVAENLTFRNLLLIDKPLLGTDLTSLLPPSLATLCAHIQFSVKVCLIFCKNCSVCNRCFSYFFVELPFFFLF